MSELLAEAGEVVDVSENAVKVLIRRHSSCEKCGACGMGKQPEMILEVEKEIDVRKGDRVLIQMQPGQLFKAAFFMYTIPLMVLIVGFLAGQRLSLEMGMPGDKAENIGIFTGFLGVACSYLLIRWLDRRRRFADKNRPKVVKIIDSVDDFANRPLE